MSGIVGGGAVGSKLVLGETFLRSFYSVYRQSAAAVKGRWAGAFVSLAPAAASSPGDLAHPRGPAPLARDEHGAAMDSPAAPPADGGTGAAAAGVAAGAAWTMTSADDSLAGAAGGGATQAVPQLPAAASGSALAGGGSAMP